MTTLREAFGTDNIENLVSMITDGIVANQEQKKQREEISKQSKVEQEKKRQKNDGYIAPRPIYPSNVDVAKLVFSLSNHTIGDVWCMPNNRRRADDILRHSNYTYLDAVIASVISCALEGDMTAAKLVLSFASDYAEDVDSDNN